MMVSSELLEMIDSKKQEGKVSGGANGLRSPENGDSGVQKPDGGGASARAQDSTSIEKEKTEDPPQRLIEHLEKQGLEAFHDEGGQPYMTIDTSKGHQTFAVRSEAAKEFLQRTAWHEWKEPLSKYKAEETTEALAAMAKFDGSEKEVFLRVGHADGRVYLDLANDEGQVVEVDASGWSIIKPSPVPFLKTNSMKALPRPEPGGTLDELRPIINTSEDANWIQVCGFLLSQFMPEGAMPVLAIQGPAGSGKSTAAKRVREVIDPSASNARNAPRNAEDVMVAAKSNFLPSYDNISGSVSSSVSDALCALATGGSMAKRANYTDFEEASMTAQRSTILNGIDELAERGDLVERSLVLRLERIERHLPESELNKRFEQAHPRVLGALLDAVSMSIRRLSKVQADQSRERIRLIDMADWIRAGESALPFAEGSFLKALEEEQAKQRIDIMEGNVLAEGLRLLKETLKEGNSYTNYASETREHLARLVEDHAEQVNGKTLSVRDDSFPANGRALSQYLRRSGKDYELATGLKLEQLPRDQTRRKRWRFTKEAA